MSAVQAVLAILGGLILLAGFGGAVWAYAKGGAQDRHIERLQSENADYLRQLNYIEPRFKSVQEQNEILRTLLDPSARLDEIKHVIGEKAEEILTAVERSATNTEAMKAVLLSQARSLDDINKHIHVDRGEAT